MKRTVYYIGPESKVTCACGKTEVVVTPGVTIKSLRCPHCPSSEKQPPKLRLVP